MKNNLILILLAVGFITFNVYARGIGNRGITEMKEPLPVKNTTINTTKQIFNYSDENFKIMTEPELDQSYVTQKNVEFIYNKLK